VVRARGAVAQTGLAFLAEAVDPAVRALARNTLSLRGVGDRPTLIADALDEQLPATHGQAGITVGHEDLRTVGDLDTHPPHPEVFLTSTTGRACHQRPGRVQLVVRP
jgi:hypothetical protein